MGKRKKTVKKTVQRMIDGSLGRTEAARVLGVSIRTVHNYVKRFLEQGEDGLRDRRRGHFRKLNAIEQSLIVNCKLSRPHRSARWIRDWLRLSVTPETIRQVLLKHHLNGTAQQRSSRPSFSSRTARNPPPG